MKLKNTGTTDIVIAVEKGGVTLLPGHEVEVADHLGSVYTKVFPALKEVVKVSNEGQPIKPKGGKNAGKGKK